MRGSRRLLLLALVAVAATSAACLAGPDPTAPPPLAPAEPAGPAAGEPAPAPGPAAAEAERARPCLATLPQAERTLLLGRGPSDLLHAETRRMYAEDASLHEVRIEVCAMPTADPGLRRVVVTGTAVSERADVDAEVLERAQRLLANGTGGELADVVGKDRVTATRILHDLVTPLGDEEATRVALEGAFQGP